ncbi:HutD family protein [uncultured Corynebacterium sp.]|uniref:HutD/Ves family protein n=1 Tax=uncultured Corynebacterium sp. TaxID=159447 RepID=UPI0025FE3448|nr:HutD family protein [uncultured Corynebacterium sp.]
MNGTGTTIWRTLRRTADLTGVPWANGRGTTVELISPDESAAYYSTFFPVDGRWRLSVASLNQRGPFSPLPGMDRIHTPLEGIGLTVDGSPHRIPALTPFAFDGGAETVLTDLPTPTRAVNLMVDRDSPAAGRLGVSVVTAGDAVPDALAAVALDGSCDLLVPHREGMGEIRDIRPGTPLAVVSWGV